MDKPYQSLFNAIKSTDSKLQQLLAKANHLKALEQQLAAALDTLDSRHYKIAAYENGCLTLAVENSWATKLRFQAPDLIEKLKIITHFKELKDIQVIIVPQLQPPLNQQKKLPAPKPLSESNRKLLAETAKYIQEPALKNAIEKLLKNKES